MYQASYFVLFYAFALLGILIVFGVLLVAGFFNSAPKEHKKPKTTLDFLAEQVQNSGGEKEVMDSVMKEFYTNFYNNYKGSSNLDAWLTLIQNITMLDYMSVEQASAFRDDLASKNPSLKKEIENSVGVSLKYREQNKRKKG